MEEASTPRDASKEEESLVDGLSALLDTKYITRRSSDFCLSTMPLAHLSPSPIHGPHGGADERRTLGGKVRHSVEGV